MSSQPAISIRNLRFCYGPQNPVIAIDNFEVGQGERVFLFGPSGSGKTTLLGIITGILHGLEGEVQVLGHAFHRLSGAQRDRVRGEEIGYIFQMFNLIPYLTALENIILPCRINPARASRIAGESIDIAAINLAGEMGIRSVINHRATELSVGQQQRVASARALLGSPRLIIADEPTSALDADHREQFLTRLFTECDKTHAALLFVSHDRSLSKLFHRTVSLPDINRVNATAL